MAIIRSNVPPAAAHAPVEFPVNDSSFIQAVRYDAMTLQASVTLKNGGEYLYQMVPPVVVDQWMQSPSKGKFYVENIRGKFGSSRLVNKTVGPVGGNHGSDRHKGRRAGGGR